MSETGIGAILVAAGIAALAGIVFLIIWIAQPVRIMIAENTVKTEQLLGEAELKRAEQNRQIQVQQATAERDSASLRAEAIKIVGQAAKDFPEYRYQEFLGAFAEALKDGKINQVIYVPTEANVPLMEAGRSVPSLSKEKQ